MYRRIPEALVVAVTIITTILVVTISSRPQVAFEPPYLSLILQTVFITMGYSLVAYVAAKSYLTTHSLIFLMLGSGVLAAASGGFVALVFPSDPNTLVTVLNVGYFLSAVLQATSAATLFRNSGPPGSSRFNRTKLIASYSAVLIVVSLLGIAAFQGITPAFFVQGVGPTPLRQVVVGVSIILFASASLIFFKFYRESHSNILYWYCLALALMTDGLVALFFARVLGGALSWTGRVAQYLSGIYLLLLVITSATGKGKMQPD